LSARCQLASHLLVEIILFLTRSPSRTHKALVDLDMITGRKLINQYEVIEEIGRGMHGKVKLARNLENGENVAIKIVPRFSKKRRLGKVTALSPQDKSKREIAILKKIRHPNVVALLEIIDDPELKKIYMVLEHVELGEIVWRKKGIPAICAFERHRLEKEIAGDFTTEEEEEYLAILERRHAIKELKRQRMQSKQKGAEDYWSIEYGAANDDDPASLPRESLFSLSDFPYSTARNGSRSTSRAATPLPADADISSVDADYASDLETPAAHRSQAGSLTAPDLNGYGFQLEDAFLRGRSPSMADSIISHMSSVDYNAQPHDPFADDFSYVPCFTLDDARATFRDTVLGLEYLHYEGIVHRDIKPANLLWTRDHRVKISDFGVSYFGRPIREGDLDDFVSESEARDFDDDLELAKTVGTPAFFAPELCYTDLGEEPPKVSEQIDVWSLGVTLYCLIFARIPFLAEDEFQMFRRIAKEDVYIPRRRLRPVDPQTSPAATSLYSRVNSAPYRDDSDLAYEDIDEELRDLLSKMLVKNPVDRIRLRDVKRHPWVVRGIDNVIAWIDDTDPSRRTAGRKIEVDDREITRAVVPLTFLERARSAMKKAVGKVMPHRPERLDSQSRRRAGSSAASSAGDSVVNLASTPHARDARRRSLRFDDYFPSTEHPLAQSVTASPQQRPADDDDQQSVSVGGEFLGHPSGSPSDFNADPDSPDRPPSTTSTTSGKPVPQHHVRTRSISNAFLALTPVIRDADGTIELPAVDTSLHQDPIAALRKTRDVRPVDESSRSRSVDRGLFASQDKRAEAKVALSTAVAPGNVELPRRPTPLRAYNADDNGNDEGLLSSPMFFSPQAIRTYQRAHPKTDDNFYERQLPASDLDERFLTAYRVSLLEAKSPLPREYKSSTPESFTQAHEQMVRRQQREDEDQAKRMQLIASRLADCGPAGIPCPPSPDDELVMRTRVRCDTSGTTMTSSSASAGNIMTPLTSPSDMASPSSTPNLNQTRGDSQIFRSDPSLPALLSGASSVSADAEGDFLLRPGSTGRPSLIDTTDSLTPPAMAKEPLAGFPLDELEQDYNTRFHLTFDRTSHDLNRSSALSSRAVEDDDSDSDDGLIMAKSKRKLPAKDHFGQHLGRSDSGPRRRDTQTSIGSTETAKKLVVYHD
jgi:SNF1-activating kinase 1